MQTIKKGVSNYTKISGVQTGYHARQDWDVNYAYQGFTHNKYFSSDRPIELNANFERPDGQLLKGFGLEIEVQCWSINDVQVLAMVIDNMVTCVFPKDLFKQQSDSSLQHDCLSSSEIITQVMTKEFIRNHYAHWQYMFNEAFKKLNISASKTGCCGMHCNISNGVFGRDKKTQDECIRKLYYIINRHYDLMCGMLKRDRARTRYCSKMDYSNAKTMDLSNAMSDHYVSFNLGHYNEGRIELRLVGGQPTYQAFRNTMETIFFLTEQVKVLKWDDLDDLTKVFYGCNKYVLDRMKDCANVYLVSHNDFETIKANSDTETTYL